MPEQAQRKDEEQESAETAPEVSDQSPAEHGKTEYGPAYYQQYLGNLPYERSQHWFDFFGNIAENIVLNLRPTSVLDAGCAWGLLVEALHKRGVDAYGVDISEYAISKVDESVADRCWAASLTEPLPKRYDLIVCIEVVEHIPPAEIDKVLANLCSATDRVLLSTSPTDFAEATHLNVQGPDYWTAAMAREGFLRNLDLDFSYITPWAVLYERKEKPLPDLVREYDRALWRARHEAVEVRHALLTTQDRLADTEARVVDEALVKHAEAERDRALEDNLRLRDLVIGRDAELGVARGQQAAAESSTRTASALVARVQARIPRTMRLVGGVLRRLQRRRGA